MANKFFRATAAPHAMAAAAAIDEEDHADSTEEIARRRSHPHGCLWVFDVIDLNNIQPLSIYEVSDFDPPWSRAAPGRFGAHRLQEHTAPRPNLGAAW